MAGPISGIPVLDPSAPGSQLPVLGSGGSQIPVIGLPRSIVGRSQVSGFDPLGVFTAARNPGLRHFSSITQQQFQDYLVSGKEQQAHDAYMNAALAGGHSQRDANKAAYDAITAYKQSLSATGFKGLVASGNQQQALANYSQQLIKRGMDPAEAYAAAQTAVVRAQKDINQPDELLNVIGKVLSIPGHIVANYMRGSHDYKQSGNTLGDAFGPLWSGIEKAVTTDPVSKYGIEDYLTEKSHDPGSGWLSNRVIQFSLSTVYDPVNYITFGATAPAKIAASRILAHGWDASSKEAIALMVGKGAKSTLDKLGLERTKMKLGTEVSHVIHDAEGNSVNFDELTNMVHMLQNRPVTLSDALIDMRGIGQQRKLDEFFHPIQQYQARRAGELTIATGAGKSQGPIRAAIGTTGRMATALALPTNVRGGGGVKFAGMQIPGTAALGATLGREARGALAARAALESKPSDAAGAVDAAFGAHEASRVPIVRGLAGAFVPRWRATLVADDADRALANLKLNEYRYRMSSLETEAGMKVSKMAQISEDGGRIDPVERRGLLTSGPAANQDLRRLKMNIMGEVSRIKTAAEKQGFKENAFNKLWKNMVDNHDDPLNALAEFKFRTETEIVKKKFIHEMLDDPRFARRWFEERTDENASPFAFYGDHSMIPAGYVPFHWENKAYAVKSTIRDALDDFAKGTPDDRWIDDFLKLLNVPQNFWKVYATTPNPSFHVMNLLGAMWNNLYGGVYNPMDYIRAIGTLYNARLENMLQEGQKAFGLISPTKLTLTSREGMQRARGIVTEAEHRGGLGRQSIFQELTTGKTFGRLPGEQTIGSRGKELVFRHPEESKRRYAFRQGRRAAGIGGIATGNPVVAAAAFAPELAGAGRKLGSAIENTVRLAPFMKAAKDPDNIRLLEKYGPIRVPGLTHPGFTKAQQAAQYDIGAALSTHFQFDYGDLTTFERKVAKTFIPFYVFMKNNFLLQASTVINRPRFINAALAMENFISEYGQDLGPEKDLLPEYFNQLDAFQIPVPKAIRDQLGLGSNALYLNPKLPFVSLNLFPPLWEIFRNNGMTSSQRYGLIYSDLMGSVGPWAPTPLPGAKIMLEAWTNTQLGLNSKIDYQRANSNDTRDTFVDAPGWVNYLPSSIRNFFGMFPGGRMNPFDLIEVTPGHYKMTATSRYILEQMATPFITNLGRSALSVEPGVTGQKGAADMVSWLTGLRLIPADPLNIHRTWAYQMRDMLQAERARLKKEGKDLSPQDLFSYHELLGSIKSLEAAYKLREQQMYGVTP